MRLSSLSLNWSSAVRGDVASTSADLCVVIVQATEEPACPAVAKHELVEK